MTSDNSFWGSLSSGFSSFMNDVSDGFSDFFSLDKTISTDSMTSPDDVLKTKSALNSLGHYETPSYGMTDIPDMPMIDGLKSFQQQNGLKVDGVMKPGGPTENALGQNLANNGISTVDLMEKNKAPSFNQAESFEVSKPTTPKPSTTPTAGLLSSTPQPLAPKAKPKVPKIPKIDPITGLADPLANAPKGKMPTKKQWEEVEKLNKAKAQKAIVPQGDTVEKRIRSIMEHPEYVKKKNPAVVKHVQDEFERAYPGEVQYDETGRMVQPKPVIKPDEVRAYDPNGELHPNDDTGFIIDEGSLFDEQPDETQTAFGANDIASNEPIEQPDNGTVTQNPDSTFTFKPDNDWDAETNATYTTSDGIEKTPQSSPYEEQVADPDWENERFEVRDPQTGKLYQMDFNGDYFNKQGNPVSLSNEAKNRLNEQFNKDEGFIETENRKKQSNASKAEQAETIEFNADAFADTLEKRLKPKGKKLGDCAAYVRVALEKAGMDTSGHPVDAKDWGPGSNLKVYGCTIGFSQ